MATPFELIYKKFLGQIDDYELAIPDESELNEILFAFLDEARSLYFPQCKKNLDAITESNGVGEFADDLNSQEQFILALCMKKAWLSPKLHSADLMRKEIGDRDYKAVQGTNYLKELSKLDDKIEDEIRRYSVEYTYKGFSLEGW
ncbi:TPA: hypothetical protein QC364_000824 [Bacillus cereus]|uniref:hypothetical protein n=1 Tax=Bacillus paranthracis TaxID=2026186 RepID=UPI002D78B969|nr:hypothetical protein [Bacillus paranthracis]HDR8454025.1 hypothetical protein [Bacillus cereus]